MISPPPNFDSLIDYHYLIYGMVLVFVAFVQKVFGIYGGLLKHPRGYCYASIAIIAATTILVLGHVDLSVNPILSRLLNVHLFSMLSIFLIFYAFSYGGVSKVDVIKGALTAGIYAALHEFVGTVFIFITGIVFNEYFEGFQIPAGTVIVYYALFFVLLAGIFVAYLAFVGSERFKLLLKVAIIMIVMSAFFMAAGNFATLNLGGATSLYGNLDANLSENLTWVIPAIYMVIEATVKRGAKLGT